jgi:hypothetical protein
MSFSLAACKVKQYPLLLHQAQSHQLYGFILFWSIVLFYVLLLISGCILIQTVMPIVSSPFNLDSLIIPTWELSTTEFEDIFLSNNTTSKDTRFDGEMSEAFMTYSPIYQSSIQTRRASMSSRSTLSINTSASSISDVQSNVLDSWSHTCDVCVDLQHEKQMSSSPEMSLFDFNAEPYYNHESPCQSSSSRSSSISLRHLTAFEIQREIYSQAYNAASPATSSMSPPASPRTSILALPRSRRQSIASSPWTCLEDAHHPLCDGNCDDRISVKGASPVMQPSSPASVRSRTSWYSAPIAALSAASSPSTPGSGSRHRFSWLDFPPKLVRVSHSDGDDNACTRSSRRKNRFERGGEESSRKYGLDIDRRYM